MEETKTKDQAPILKEVSDPKVSGIRNRLTITVREIAPQQRWTLHDRLTDYSVAKVLSNWHAPKEPKPVGPRVIDLDGASAHGRNS